MRAYLASLDRLLTLDIAILAPGHGYLIGTPQRELRRLIAHRLARENKVRTALETLGPATLEALVPVVYDDVEATRHKAAARSLLAHLEKLIADGTVCRDGDGYALVPAGQC